MFYIEVLSPIRFVQFICVAGGCQSFVFITVFEYTTSSYSFYSWWTFGVFLYFCFVWFCFLLLWTMLNILVCSFISYVCLGIGLLGHRICVCSVVVDTGKQLPKVVVPDCTPTSHGIRFCVAPNPCQLLACIVLNFSVSHCDVYCNSLIRIRLPEYS